MEKITKDFEIELTGEQIIEKAQTLAELHADAAAKRKELTAIKKERGDAIKAIEEEISKICRCIEVGKELQRVEAEMHKDFDTNSVKFYKDGTLIEERAMTVEERQQDLFVRDGSAPPPQDPAEAVFDEEFPSTTN